VAALGDLAGIEDHHPDLDVRRDGVTVRLITITDDYYGMSQRDVELARRVSALARDQRLAADPSAVRSLLVVPGAARTAGVMPFWQGGGRV
jgi:4a-hydroxytetrahydrobiopterin dehydratase